MADRTLTDQDVPGPRRDYVGYGRPTEPMRTSQRNLHHQLLRSGVLIFPQTSDGSLRRLRPMRARGSAASYLR